VFKEKKTRIWEGKTARNNTGGFVWTSPVPQYASYALRFPGPNEFRFGWYRSFLVVLFGSLSLHDNTGVGGNTGPQLSSLLTDGTGDGGTLHLTLVVDDL
jgi:hypothetical protein